MDILLPIILLLSAGAIAGVLLTLASVFFAVPENQTATAVRECLPGVNCGACGFSGCDGYAKALAEGKVTETNLCVPGGDGTSREIAEILGLEVGEVVEKVAYVACNGSCEPEERKYNYNGPKTCKNANMFFAGDRLCTFACLGYGDCIRVCPRDAICLNSKGVAEINPKKCIGCGLCAKECPNGIIHIVKDITRVVVKCNNHNKGAEVRHDCKNGCIACGKCEKTCPHGAITVIDNLARIDYDKCTGCGKCREVCPVKCIHEGNFICGAHFE